MKTRIFLALAAASIAPLAPIARAQNHPSPTQTFGARARLQTIKRSGKNWSATAKYPVFRADNLLARYANWQTRLDAQTQLRAGIGQITEYLAGDAVPRNPYEYELTPSLSFYGSKIISLEQNSFYDMGGAHPSTIIGTRNYGLTGARPQLLTLGDFFRGSNYRAATAAKLLARLKENGALWVVEGSVKTLNTDQLNSFVVEADGLKWIFSPYEMGPYSDGITEAKLKTSELGPDFRRELLAK